jgi:hypothetical protein
MPELAEIFARYGPAYLDRYGPTMLPSHRRAMADIRRCRTEAMGGQVFCCNRCGRTHYVYHSCRNRSCPKCHHQQTEAWLEQRRQELLPVRYFHLVFTVPRELHATLRSHQVELYGRLMQAVAGSLLKLAADPHYVGGQVGILAILQTWGRTLAYHPHVHCLVTGGGVDRRTQEWRAARDNYLVPVTVLSRMVRDTFKDLLGERLGEWNIPTSVWRVPWNVYCDPVHGSVENVLNYLARYVYRIAITNNRILAIDEGQVTFQYQDTRDRQWKRQTLKAEEFIRRFLQHVLPQSFHKVRYYGLWAPGNRLQLRRLQWCLGTADHGSAAEMKMLPAPESPTQANTEHAPTCPYCGKGTLVLIGLLRRGGRGPP